MRLSNPRARAGITLAEILISLLIMAIGLISLATLFPLSLLRVRAATRYSRSTLLAKSGIGDMGVRNLLDKRSFNLSWYNLSYFPVYFDPFTIDPNWTDANNQNGTWLQPGVGPGIPVAYDPLWRANAQPNPKFNLTKGYGTYPNVTYEARFGYGMGFIRPDPVDGAQPSANGLQRITNFLPWGLQLNWPFVYPALGSRAPDVAGSIFASNDDIVWQTSGNKSTQVGFFPSATGVGNPIVPDLSNGGLVSDWKYTWFFTGYQADVNDPSPDVFVGNIVVCENRPFAFDIQQSPLNGPTPVATGEVVVEAVFGFSANLNLLGYGVGGDNVVLLRWPAGVPDPDVKVGGWIADVTYERNSLLAASRFGQTLYPGQRCYWYRVTKRSTPTTDNVVAGYRTMTVFLDSPVQAKTQAVNGSFRINAALVMPSVVNVFPKVIYVR